MRHTIIILALLLLAGGCTAIAPQSEIDSLMGKPVAEATILWGPPATHAPLGDASIYTWHFGVVRYDGETLTVIVTLWTDEKGIVTRNRRWKGWR